MSYVTSTRSATTETVPTTCVIHAGARWLSEYNLITIGNLDTNSSVENRALVCGDYSGRQSSSFAIHRKQNSSGPSLEIRNNITSGSVINVFGGSVTSASFEAQKISSTQYKLNGRLFAINDGDQGASASVDSTLYTKCSKVIHDLQQFSLYLSQLIPNNNVSIPSLPDSLNFIVNSVNEYGLAVFNVDCNDALSNTNVQQIEIKNNTDTKAVVINLSGRACSYETGNMGGSWLNELQGRSRTLWNVYERPLNEKIPMYIRRNFMGVLLAPYYSVETTVNIDGTVAVKNMVARAELHKPQLIFASCTKQVTIIPTVQPTNPIVPSASVPFSVVPQTSMATTVPTVSTIRVCRLIILTSYRVRKPSHVQ